MLHVVIQGLSKPEKTGQIINCGQLLILQFWALLHSAAHCTGNESYWSCASLKVPGMRECLVCPSTTSDREVTLAWAIDHVEDLYQREEKGKSWLLNNADLSFLPINIHVKAKCVCVLLQPEGMGTRSSWCLFHHLAFRPRITPWHSSLAGQAANGDCIALLCFLLGFWGWLDSFSGDGRSDMPWLVQNLLICCLLGFVCFWFLPKSLVLENSPVACECFALWTFNPAWASAVISNMDIYGDILTCFVHEYSTMVEISHPINH